MAQRPGEGWDWVLVQNAACPQCGYNAAAVPTGSLGEAGSTEAAEWRRFLSDVDLGYLKTSPRAGVWSPAQYAAHVRDMFAVFGDRVLLAVAEDDPVVPWFEPSEAEWVAFNELTPAELAEGIEAQARRMAAVLAGLQGSDWDRTARRDGTDSFTVAGLARFAVHEAHHHLLDASGALRASREPPTA
jgi:hypothetical protein